MEVTHDKPADMTLRDREIAANAAATGRPFMEGVTQMEFEIERLCELVAIAKPKIIVEIGVNEGYDLGRVCRALTEKPELVVAIDINPGTATFPGIKAIGEIAPLEVIAIDSNLPEAKARLIEILAGRRIDVLLIDQLHDMESTQKDLDMYVPLVRQGGMVGLHDILNKGYWNGVVAIWNQLKIGNDYVEIRSKKSLGDTFLGWGIFWR